MEKNIELLKCMEEFKSFKTRQGLRKILLKPVTSTTRIFFWVDSMHCVNRSCSKKTSLVGVPGADLYCNALHESLFMKARSTYQNCLYCITIYYLYISVFFNFVVF